MNSRLVWAVRTTVLLAITTLCAAVIWAAARVPASGSGYPSVALVESPVLRKLPSGVPVLIGYGSAIAADPLREGYFCLLTDRGPNTEASGPDEKTFVDPSFSPHLGVFKLVGSRLRRVSIVVLKDPTGQRLSGLPTGRRAFGLAETAVDLAGNPLTPSHTGVDPEGVAWLKDGTFWISDEYGPDLLHVDARGRTIERIGPQVANSHGRMLPRVLALRRPNRGMEGLSITPDERTLVGIMQSSLDNPSASVRRTTRITRLLTFDLHTGASRQLVYLQEEAELSNTEIAAVSNIEFLVLERDDGFSGHGRQGAKYKRLYRIDISRATDVSDPANRWNGKLFGGKTVEQLTERELGLFGITPVNKTLAADLLRLPGGYPHDKPEGLAVLKDSWVAVCNDDDFGIVSDATGEIVRKLLPGLPSAADRTRVRFVRLGTSGSRPLH